LSLRGRATASNAADFPIRPEHGMIRTMSTSTVVRLAAGSAVWYFGVTFAIGFALGVVRVSLLEPRLGERWSELLESPFMLIAILIGARRVARRHPRSGRVRLAIGLGAAGVLLGAEIVVGVTLRGLTTAASLFERDPISGAVYLMLVGVFAFAPWLSGRVRPFVDEDAAG
jgi:hypothetical protein